MFADGKDILFGNLSSTDPFVENEINHPFHFPLCLLLVSSWSPLSQPIVNQPSHQSSTDAQKKLQNTICQLFSAIRDQCLGVIESKYFAKSHKISIIWSLIRNAGGVQFCVGRAASWYLKPYVMSLSPDWHLYTNSHTCCHHHQHHQHHHNHHIRFNHQHQHRLNHQNQHCHTHFHTQSLA